MKKQTDDGGTFRRTPSAPFGRAGKFYLLILALVVAVPAGIAGCSKGDADGKKADTKADGKGDKGKGGTEGSPQPGKDGETIKVGIMHSLSGTMAISETSLKDAELMAIEEINAAGGVLGKKIEPIVEDPYSDFTKGFPEKAKKLLTTDNVVAVFGCWTSASRQSVKPIFEKYNGILFYPVQYEGNECSKNIIYTGAAPNQQIIPAVKWLLENKGKKFYLLGSNYVFPQEANRIVKAALKKWGGEVVHEEYTKLGEKEYATVVERIKGKNPDVIFSTINGDSNVPFYNQLKGAGISADKMVVCAMSVAEDELRAIDPEAVKGHLAAWNYFQSLDTPKNKEFVKKFQAYTKDPSRVTDDPIEAAYFQVYLWKLAVEKAGTTEVNAVLKAIRGVEFDAPEGKVKVDDKNNHTWKPFRMGKARADRQFEIIYDSAKHGEPWIRPMPYTELLYPNLDCDVTRGGRVKLKAR